MEVDLLAVISGDDFVVNEKEKTVNLTEEGVAKVEKFFHIDNLADADNLDIQHNIILSSLLLLANQPNV